MRKTRKFDTTEKECEWCHKKFEVTWKYRKQRFCSTKCMYDWRKDQNWEELKCLNCGQIFKSRKNYRHDRTDKKRMFCSNKCSLSSEYKKEKLRYWMKDNNPMYNGKSVNEIAKTKLKRYGNKNYNNMKKNVKTCMKKYGIPYSIGLVSPNGKRISNIQRNVYGFIKTKYNTAELEKYLNKVNLSVDIYIPNKKIIIETNGDYWHMNPNKYKETDYNKSTHKTAKETWEYDNHRRKILTDAGYKVIMLWETDIKNGNYFKILKENKV